MIGVLGYFAVCFAAIVLYIQIRNTLSIGKAEQHMAHLMIVKMNREKVENLRDILLDLKAKAIKAGYQDMEKFYDIEHQMNLLSESLDRMERHLIAQGLQQPSGKGRLEYMLKLVDLSLATA